MTEEHHPTEPEEQVEDLDMYDEESEDVKGGFSWGLDKQSPALKFGDAAAKIEQPGQLNRQFYK